MSLLAAAVGGNDGTNQKETRMNAPEKNLTEKEKLLCGMAATIYGNNRTNSPEAVANAVDAARLILEHVQGKSSKAQ
jgi:hypothetical protein